MRRFFIVLIVLSLLFLQVAFADFDYSNLKQSLSENSDFYTIEEQDSGSSFITSNFFSIDERSFEHKHQSDNYYSYFENDWIVLDYAEVEATPIRRLWIYISSKTPLNISSVTFSFDNNVCTFSNFFRPMIDITQYSNGDSLQSICLVMGNDNLKFRNAVSHYMYNQDDVSAKAIMKLEKIKMTLHGTEDIDVELPNTFMLDYRLTDLVFPDEDYVDMVKLAGTATTFNIKTVAEATGSNILQLGENAEFAIQTNGSYVYNTLSSDLSGYETTDKWMFDHDENTVCIVHSYTESADIKYYSTSDNNELSSWELIKRCIESVFNEDANFFNDRINYQRDGSKLIFTAIGDIGTSKAYFAYTFVILKKGIIFISANSIDDDNVIDFVAEIADSIMTKNENGFIK